MELVFRNLDNRRDECFSLDQIGTFESQLETHHDGKLDLVFVTGNDNKVRELKQLLRDLEWVNLTVLNINLPELQASNILDVVEEKCKVAYRHVTNANVENQQSKPMVLIEDTSLKFKALNGMPGPYIKWFMDAIGVEGLPRLLTGFSTDSAEAESVFGLMVREKEIAFCRGLVSGRIVKSRGSSWGWDSIFEEGSSGRTFGEMDVDTKQKLSHRSKAAAVFKKYLSTRQRIVIQVV